MQWTKELPTQFGYYWLKRLGYKEIVEFGESLNVFRRVGDRGYFFIPDDLTADAEWQGPITPEDE